ncbi:integrase [Tanacetum coccineum]
MRTLFRSQELWGLVKNGIAETSVDETGRRESMKKDAKALFFIQQAVDEMIFSRIAAANSAKEAWDTLKTEYEGSTKEITVKLQFLRRDFESAVMKGNETVQEYLARISSIVSQMRAYGDKVADEIVVAKILRSLSPKFDHVVAAIEESKDLSTYSVDELMGSLQTHEARINRNMAKEDEHAFQVQGEHARFSQNRGRGRGGFRGRGRGRMSYVQCTNCKKYGHKEDDCWSKDKQAQYAEQEEDEYLFMTYVSLVSKGVWYLDSACSNHMTGDKEKFKNLDEALKSQSAHNLLSVGQLLASGFIIHFEDNACTVKRRTGEVLLKSTMTSNRMFPVDFSCADVYGMMNCKQESTEVWHQRYGHLYVKGLQLLSNKDMVEGLPTIKELSHMCEGCALGKQSRRSFPVGKAKRAEARLEVVHADICGPMRTESHAGSRYFLLFVDDYSRMCWVYFLKSKSEAFDFFKKFKALAENQCNRKLKILRTDRGGEFLSNEFSRFCDEYGIKRELTAPYTPEQNGIAERKNRTIVEMARSMLKTKNLEDEFWAEAVATAVYLINISPTKAVWNVTPYEAWYESKPSVSHLRIFGCTCYAIISSGRGKLDPKTKKYIFVGYSTCSKAYRLYDVDKKSIIISRDVQFNEQEAWNTNSTSSTVTIEAQDEGIHEEQPTNTQNGQNSVDIPSGSITSEGSTSSGSISSELSQEDTDNEELQLRRSKRGNVPKRHFEVEGKSCAFALFVTDPTNAESAINNEVWRRAMQEEIDAIERNGTWKQADLPKGKKAISLKWIFKTEVITHKEQNRSKSMQQPEYFEVAGEEHKVYKLEKALYGLKQAPRAWYSKIDEFFHENGFERSPNEPTLYVKRQGTEGIMLVSLYVDDMIYTGSSLQLISEFKEAMMKKFEMSDLGKLSYFLGLEVQQGADGIFLSQQKYANDILNQFSMVGCKTVGTPMNVGEKLASNDGTGMADARKFRSLVGRLIYLTHTRPDLTYAVGIVSRFMHCPSKQHFGAAKRILRYIAGTTSYGIWYSRKEKFELVGYSDSDWAGEKEDMKSTSGNCFTLGSGVVSWASKKQATVALSSTEAEYVAATKAACQAIWLRRMLSDLNQTQNGATTIFCAMTRNRVPHYRTKHIAIKHHFIRELVAERQVELEFCRTDQQLADLFTKSLSRGKFEEFRDKLLTSNFESRGSVEK